MSITDDALLRKIFLTQCIHNELFGEFNPFLVQTTTNNTLRNMKAFPNIQKKWFRYIHIYSHQNNINSAENKEIYKKLNLK